MKFVFPLSKTLDGVTRDEWMSWAWQMRNALKSADDFSRYFDLTAGERRAFEESKGLFQIRATPYYASLASRSVEMDPIRRILMPTELELTGGTQAMLDPLGEKKNNPAPRIVHRYPDRVLFLVTGQAANLANSFL
ncbi:MAG: KamA family radical SAM protein, partial [Bdellovibrionota bacterium]